jgi:hypothetical protein
VRLRGTTFWARKIETLKVGRWHVVTGATKSDPGTTGNGSAFSPSRARSNRRVVMPVLVMWAVPAVIVIGGVGYWLVHMH